MRKVRIEYIALIALGAIVLGVILSNRTGPKDVSPTAELANEDAQKPDADFEVATLQQFDLVGDGYHLLYEELAQPNTLEQVEPPVITGNTEADAYIRNLAEERGYVLRRIAATEDDLLLADSELLQNRAQRDWLALQTAAENDGVFVFVRSGYRDVDTQRRLFVERLATNGVSTSAVASGSQDAGIQETLRLVAPPGYSRHHDGYTIDVRSSDAATFSSSAGFRWMSENNYKNTLKYGFIPSYPEGAVDQGPDPESWEFVWVGRDLIDSQIDS